MQGRLDALVSLGAMERFAPAEHFAGVDFSLHWEAVLLGEPLAHPGDGGLGFVPVGVVHQQAAQSKSTCLRTGSAGVAAFVDVEQMHARKDTRPVA